MHMHVATLHLVTLSAKMAQSFSMCSGSFMQSSCRTAGVHARAAISMQSQNHVVCRSSQALLPCIQLSLTSASRSSNEHQQVDMMRLSFMHLEYPCRCSSACADALPLVTLPSTRALQDIKALQDVLAANSEFAPSSDLSIAGGLLCS